MFIFTWATVFTNPHADTFNKSTAESQVSHEHAIFSNYALPYRGAWLPEGHGLITDTHVPDTATHVALLSSDIKAAQLSKMTGLPMIIAIPDSGATANVSYDIKHLINLRPCTEMFGQANGQLSQCVGVGDMPVIARTQKADGTVGKPCQILITNVRCVPNFAYTLLSVTLPNYGKSNV